LPPPFAATYERELSLNLKTPIEDRSPPSVGFKELGYDDKGHYVDFLAFLPAFSIRQTIFAGSETSRPAYLSTRLIDTMTGVRPAFGIAYNNHVMNAELTTKGLPYMPDFFSSCATIS
jgi:hypothetical protein